MSSENDIWEEAGTKKPTKVIDETLLDTISLDDLRLTENNKYLTIVKECRELHKTLLRHEQSGKLGNFAENPSLIGDYLMRLRLNANQLFTFKNIYIDILSDLQREYAHNRQKLYESQLAAGKSASAAEKHAREMSRVDESTIGVIENNIQQIHNEYERFNGICMTLQSRLKEFNTERIMN